MACVAFTLGITFFILAMYTGYTWIEATVFMIVIVVANVTFCIFDRCKGAREPHLMSAANQVQVVAPQKLRDNVLAERERHTTVVLFT